MTKTTPDYAAILRDAHAAAAAEGARHADHGACGFAWVTIDGNHALARWCRKAIPAGAPFAQGRGFFGSKGYPKGHQWWSPGYHGQSVDAKEAAARVFRDALAAHGIVAEVHSRLD
jgi:hypothetical protein